MISTSLPFSLALRALRVGGGASGSSHPASASDGGKHLKWPVPRGAHGHSGHLLPSFYGDWRRFADMAGRRLERRTHQAPTTSVCQKWAASYRYDRSPAWQPAIPSTRHRWLESRAGAVHNPRCPITRFQPKALRGNHASSARSHPIKTRKSCMMLQKYVANIHASPNQQNRPATIRPLTCGFVWCQQRDSNPQPSAYKAAALPLELCWHRRGAQCSTGMQTRALPHCHDACCRYTLLGHHEIWTRRPLGSHGNLRGGAAPGRAGYSVTK